MKYISATKNPAIQEARALQTSKGRSEKAAFWLEGEHMVGEALKECPQDLLELFVTEGCEGRYAKLLSRLPKGAECFCVSERVMAALSQVKCPQGIAAVCRIPGERPADAMGEKLVLLENVQDPGNVGTILRTLDAAGFSGCILTPGCADPYGDKALRASMGSVFRVPVWNVPSAAAAGRALRNQGYELIGAELHGEDFYQREERFGKLCLMIGNEGSGLSSEALSVCSLRYRLPMRGGAESLNAAIAAAIFMYDLINR